MASRLRHGPCGAVPRFWRDRMLVCPRATSGKVPAGFGERRVCRARAAPGAWVPRARLGAEEERMEITERAVRDLEALAALRLSDAERERLRGQLQHILDYMEQLKAI